MIQFGNDNIKEIYVGSDTIKEVYYGSDLVWKSNSDFVLFESNKVNLGFEQGYTPTDGIGFVDIGVDKMQIYRKYSQFRIVSSQKYNLSNFSEIVIEWEQTEDVGNAYSYIRLSTYQKPSTPSRDSFDREGQFARREDVYDISNLTGLRYVEIALYAASVVDCFLNIYKITLR